MLLWEGNMNIVSHNISAMNANRQLNIVTSSHNKVMEKLSSGYRINRGADDASGLAISEKMRYQIRGMHAGAENIQDAISFCKVADGALSEVHDMLGRMKTLAVKAANDTCTSTDREFISNEVQSLALEINRISANTEFNEYKIFTDEYNISLSGSTNIVKTYDDADGNLAGISILGKTSAFPSSFSYIDDETGEQRFHAGSYDYSSGTTTVTVSASEGAILPSIKGSFEIKASSSGINIAGTNVAWKDVYYADGSSVADNSTKGGMCYFNILGGTGGFAIPEGQSLDNIADSINRLISQNQCEYEITFLGKRIPGVTPDDDSTGRFKITMRQDNRFHIQSASDIKQAFNANWQRFSGYSLGLCDARTDTQSGATNLISTVNDAYEAISELRSTFGAYTNLFEHMYKTNMNAAENLQAAESVIRDADMSKLAVELAKESILEQVGQAILSQANQNSNRILQLLQ